MTDEILSTWDVAERLELHQRTVQRILKEDMDALTRDRWGIRMRRWGWQIPERALPRLEELAEARERRGMQND